MSIHRLASITLLSLSLTGALAGGVSAQPTAMQRYDFNPNPLLAITPSLHDDLPLPSLQDTPGGKTDGTPASAETDASNHGGQILYDVPTRSPFTPYLGVGGPTARLDRIRNPTPSNNTGDAVQGYQGVAGLAYNLDRNVQFNLGYRYSNFHRQDTPVPEDTEVDSQNRDGRAMLLFKYELGGNAR